MKDSRLANAMQYLDEDLISQAELYVPTQKKWYQSNWMKWGAIAASIVLMMALSIGLFCKWQDADVLLIGDMVWVETSLKVDKNNTQVNMEKPNDVEGNRWDDGKPGYATHTMAGVVSANKTEGIYYIVATLAAIGIFMGISLFGINEKNEDNL